MHDGTIGNDNNHKDLKMKTVKEEIIRIDIKLEERIRNHHNVAVEQILENSNVNSRDETIRPGVVN